MVRRLMERKERMLDIYVYAHPGHLIRRAHQRATSAFMEATKALDITPAQFAALVAVADHPGIDATRLSELIAFDRPTTGNVLQRLERRGHLMRKPHSTDRRTKEIFLTAQGRRILNAITRANARIFSRTLQGLSKTEQTQLLALLARLVGMDGPAPGGKSPRRERTVRRRPRKR